MTHHDPAEGSFEAFKNSFAYGSRNDLNFKFLKGLSDDEAATFFQELLWKLGDALVDGEFDRLVEHVYDWQLRVYSGGEAKWTYDEGPFTPLAQPLSDSRLTLISSSGHFVAGEDPCPFGVVTMTQEEATDRILQFLKSEPQLSSVPFATPRDALRVRHPGYDTRAAAADPNVVFPLDRLQEMAEEGLIGELTPEAHSFVGACSQRRLLRETAPRWVASIRQQNPDAALLVPV